MLQQNDGRRSVGGQRVAECQDVFRGNQARQAFLYEAKCGPFIVIQIAHLEKDTRTLMGTVRARIR